MCDPLTIAGIALTLGSTVANYSAQAKNTAARNDALAAERIRQNGFNQQADALNLTSRDRYTDFSAQQSETGLALGDFLRGQTVAEPTPVAAMPTSSSDIVVQNENQQRADARDFTDQQGDALGQLRAFGDVLANKSLLGARDAGQIAQINGFKTGSAGVVPYELEKASRAGDGLQFLGDLLGGAGSVATGAGLSGGSLPFTTNAAASKSIGFIPGIGSMAAAAPKGIRLGSLFGT